MRCTSEQRQFCHPAACRVLHVQGSECSAPVGEGSGHGLRAAAGALWSGVMEQQTHEGGIIAGEERGEELVTQY